MEFLLLGPLEARDGDRVIRLAGKQRALVADLLLHANRIVPVERLVDDLWGEAVPDTAVKALQVHVSKARKALPGTIETRPPGYVIRLDDDELDLHRFERLFTRGRAALAAGDPAGAVEHLGGALALWRGRALAELEEPFAAAERSRLEGMRVACLEERIEAELQLGRHAALVTEIEATIREHLFRERLRRQLLVALYRSGRQVEALAAYHDFRSLLRNELGMEPSEELRELERRMLRQDPGLLQAAATRRPRIVPAAPVGAPARGPLIVGREAELGRLAGLLEEALSGERRVAFVTGEPGAGKSTLVEAFLAAARLPDGGRIGRGQCIEHRGPGEPYLPILEALGRLCRAEPPSGLLALLRELAPTWLAQLPALVAPDEHEELRTRAAESTRERMLREMVELLDAATVFAPLVLVLEDMHWSDLSTVDLLEAVARRPDPAKLLVIATFRPADAGAATEPVRRLARDLRIRNLCSEIAVGGLSADAVRAYLAARVPGLADEAGIAELLRARTLGNPLFVEKLTEAWVAEGRLGGNGEAPDLERLASYVPASLRQLIAQRLELVNAEGRDVLEAASVVGSVFATSAVAAATGRDVRDVDAVCDTLAQDQLFLADAGTRTWPDGSRAVSYAFTHDLCQQVLEEAISPGRRRALHDEIAAYLERVGGERSDELAVEIAWHASNGHDRGRAVTHLIRAAERALDRRAFHEARTHLGSALDALATLPADEGRARLELKAQTLVGTTEIGIDGWGSCAAESAYRRAQELAGLMGAADELALVLFRLASMHEVRGDYRLSGSLLEESFALPSDAERPTRQIYSHELLACTLFHQGDHHAAIRHADTALSLFGAAVTVDALTPTTGETPPVSCNVWAAFAQWHLGRADEARERAEKAVAASTLGASRIGRAMAQAQAAVIALYRGETESARRWADAALEAAEELGHPYWGAVARVARGAAIARAGDVDAGLDELREGIDLARATGARMDEPFYLALLAEEALAAGRVEEAEAALADAWPPGKTGRDFFYEPELLRLEALVRQSRGDAHAARSGLRKAHEAARKLDALALELRAATSLVRLEAGQGGDLESAGAALASVLDRLPEGDGTADVREARALLAELGVTERPREGGSDGRPAPGRRERLPVEYAESGGLSIAYQVSGAGPFDMVLVPGFVSHLELDWDHPAHARFLERLGSWARLIRFDKRGTGLSDRAVGLPDLETRMDDVRAVMDAAGSERAVLFGYSEGGPLSILFAATYPERVHSLVLYGAWVKRLDPDDDYPWAPTREQRAAFIERIGTEWGFEADMRVMCPSADEETARWWGERCRAAASPGGVRALMEMNSLVDVRDLLPSIRVPTLVVHRTGDLDVSVEEGRYVASRIPGARFVELPGIDHFPSIDADQILDAIEPFVTGTASARPSPAPDAADTRVLATILMTDLVASTERARSLGDRAWADLLGRHHAVVREELARFRGTEIDNAGDGFLALFDGPARAIRCGLSVVQRLRPLGLAVRVGVHTGEVERHNGGARGVAVHLAARVTGRAAEGEVLVTETTRDLSEGSGLAFDDRGEFELKGFDRPRRLYVAHAD